MLNTYQSLDYDASLLPEEVALYDRRISASDSGILSLSLGWPSPYVITLFLDI
jgi:hypothetical protein